MQLAANPRVQAIEHYDQGTTVFIPRHDRAHLAHTFHEDSAVTDTVARHSLGLAVLSHGAAASSRPGARNPYRIRLKKWEILGIASRFGWERRLQEGSEK